LHGLAGLDVMEADLMVVAPSDELGRDEFGAIVDPNLAWQRAAFPELLKHSDDSIGRQRGVHFDGKGFAHSFVDHIERSEAFAVIEGVVHEIHGPLKIRLRRSIEGLPDTIRQPTFGAPGQIELHGAVHSPDAFVVPCLAFEPHPMETLPKAPTTMFADHFIKPSNYRSIMFGLIPLRTVVTRAPKA
jgi:hypothetical protein